MISLPNLVEIIKKSAVEAVEASNPINIVYATVISINPLKIVTEQKLPLSKEQLVLTRNVTDYEITLDNTEHIIKNALKVNEKVVLIREQGGQKYIVWDRV